MIALQKQVKQILNSWIGVIVFIVTLFLIQTPRFFSVMPTVKAISDPVRAFVLIALLFCFFVLSGGIKNLFRNELLFWGSIIWGILLCVSMKINGKPLDFLSLKIIAQAVTWVLLISIYSKVDFRKYLLTFFLYYLVINTVNNACVLFFFNTGMWMGPFAQAAPEYGFFGHVNEGITCGLNSLLPGLIYSRKYGKHWDLVNAVNLVYSLYTAIAIDCVAQIVMYIIIAVVLILCWIYDRWPGIQKLLIWINLRTVMVFNLLIFVAVIILGNTGWMEKIGIDPRIHGRRELWDTVLISIFDHPVIGNGYTSWISVIFENGSRQTFWHQHSVYLKILYEMGLIGVVLFIAIFIVCIIQLNRAKDFSMRFLIGAIVGFFFLIMVIEIVSMAEIFLLLSFCYYFPRYLNQNKK